MITDTMTSPISMVSHIIPNTDHSTANRAHHAQAFRHEEDDRSSSLSEIGERADHDEPENPLYDDSDMNDTEAETERIEESPQKSREQQNVLITSTHNICTDRTSLMATPLLPRKVDNGLLLDGRRVERSSEIRSLADFGEEERLSASPSASRKRKRLSFEQDYIAEPSTKGNTLLQDAAVDALVEDPTPGVSAAEYDHEIVVDTDVLATDETGLHESRSPRMPYQRHQKSKRKGEKIKVDVPEQKDNEVASALSLTEHEENQETVYSNEEDCENEDTGNVPGADNAAKNEEGVVQKTSALSSLNMMEKYFATFRDKLFDERLSQCNEELAMLESGTPNHPELVAMKNIIDQRRDQKLKYEQNLIKHKLETLQRESVANKAQVHSQYMQTARAIRDSSLEMLNKEFYQLQRERRSVDGDVPDYLYEFSTKRSQRILQQTAYNAEVSILSGFAKYVGFPAAPEISKAKPKDVEEDLRNMGMPTNVPTVRHNHPPVLRAVSTTSNFSRQRTGADEHFLEQNPWANPQHPSHHQQRQLHRQLSGLSRAATPSSTTVAQTRIVGLTETQGSASMVPDPPSGRKSSTATTPATGGAVKLGLYGQNLGINNPVPDSTPSRGTGSLVEATPAISAPFEILRDRGKGSHPSRFDQSHSPSLLQNLSQETQTPKTLPKPLPFLHTGGGSSSILGPRTSTPGGYNAAKAEDQSNMSRHSPIPQYHTAPVATSTNGTISRFAAR